MSVRDADSAGTIDFALRKQLRSFTLDVRGTFARGVTVLAGPSGGGKTTLLRAIAGLDAPDSGRIAIDGEVVADRGRSVRTFRRGIGYVFQDYALFRHLDVLANVGYGLRARGVARPERDDRARSWLGRLGIAALAGARPDALSGGERQRVAVARALTAQPRALLLDEPFAALDRDTRERVRAQLAPCFADLAIPIVLVTHDEQDAEVFGAPIVRLARGEFV